MWKECLLSYLWTREFPTSQYSGIARSVTLKKLFCIFFNLRKFDVFESVSFFFWDARRVQIVPGEDSTTRRHDFCANHARWKSGRRDTGFRLLECPVLPSASCLCPVRLWLPQRRQHRRLRPKGCVAHPHPVRDFGVT